MKNQGMKRSLRKGLNFRFKPVVLAMAAVFPFSTVAGIVVDAGQHLNVSSAANGTPLININNPNGKGVSHNRYAEFDVGKEGVIFNNSMQDGVSKTGGYVIKNNQLASEAQVILNEVTGAKGSHLAGSMEVFGRSADLIVANESGITVNGVSTINANNLTLSTGKVNFDEAGNVRLAVERGHVSVEGTGINTEGLSYFDIISRSAALTGEIAGTAEVKIVTGLNDYDTASRSHSVRSRTAGDTPAVAISGTQLGSMYGSRIQLISTESGAGVTHEGSIVGSGGIDIDADGHISLAAVVSKNEGVSIAGRSIALNNQAGAGGVSAQNDVILAALANLQINSDVIAQTGSIRIDAGSLLQSAARLLAKNSVQSSGTVPAIRINVADRYILNGTLYAVDASGNRIDGAEVTLSQGRFVVKVNAQVIADARVISDASIVSGSGDITVTAGSMENNAGVINAEKGSLLFTLTDSLVNRGTVQANGSVEFVGGQLTNAGLVNTSSDLKLTLGRLENSGSLYAERVSVAAAEVSNQGIIIADNGEIAVEATESVLNSGTLQAEDDVRLAAKALHISGTVNAAKNAVLNASSLVNQGNVQGGNILATADTMNNSGNLLTKTGDISLTVSDINNSGIVQAANAVTAKGKTVRNKGEVTAINGELALTLSDVLENSGALNGNNISIVTEKFNNAGEIISEKGHLSLENRGSGSAVNSGVIQAQSGTITTDGEWHNSGDIGTANELTLSAQKVSNSGEIASYGDLRLTIDSEFNNAGESAIFSADGLLSITGKTSSARIKNSDGAVIQSREGDINISGISALDNSEARIYATGTLNVEQVATLTNTDAQLGGGNINIRHVESLINNGADALIAADNSMTIADVSKINNNQGTISANLSLAFEKVKSLVNSAANIITGEELTFNSVESLINSDGAVISSLYSTLLLAGVDNIKNISGSAIEAAEKIYIDNATVLSNSDDSGIYSEGNISVSNVREVNNAGSVITNASLILSGVEVLVNRGEYALLQGLDIIISKISSIANQDYGTVLAEDKLKISEVALVLNEAAAFIQANDADISADKIVNTGYETQIVGVDNVSLTAKEIANSDQAGIFSEHSMKVAAEVLINDVESDIYAASYSLDVGTLTNRGSLSSDNSSGNSLIKTALLDNEDGRISNAGAITVTADKLVNKGEGTIFGAKSLTLNLQGDYNNAEGVIMSTNELAINTTGNVTIDKAMESFGTVHITAGNIYNNESIVSANSIYLTATNIVNNINSLIYSMQNSVLNARQAIINKIGGNILSQSSIVMEAEKIHNQAGVIRSEGNMWLDAGEILNESTYKNASWDYTAYQDGYARVAESGVLWNKMHTATIYIPGMASQIALDTRAEISSGGNLYINQDSTADSVVKNQGGLIQAKNNLFIRGDLYNTPQYVSVSTLDYLQTPLTKDIELHFYSKQDLGSTKDYTLKFSSVYQMLNYLYGDGIDNGNEHKRVDSDSKQKFTKALQKIGSSNTALNALMNKLFGETWKTVDYSFLNARWELLRSTSASEGGSRLAQMMYYFLPAEKAAIVAGNNFVHTGGSFNNGIASEVAGEVKENQVVSVQVGDETVNTLEQGYEASFNKKNIAEIKMGIGTLPTVSVLTSIKGLFEKSQAFIDYISSLGKSGSAGVESLTASVQSGTGAKNQVVPMYETRPTMIDQNQYFGSDYFFEKVGYNSSEPIIVIGDNYFISELLRRQLNESTGTFYAVKYGVEGADLVQMLFDNAGEALDNGASFVVGQALTQQQIESLEQDIVWFVTETIDGVDVLVPRVYLASQTVEEIKTVNETGIALVHAGNDAIVDADNIQNTNAVISSGNDLYLLAENDINNVSSGMNAGIEAGGSVKVISHSGNIINSGSAINAGNDVSLIAKEGDVTLIASVGRDEHGNQKISAYEDGITAGGNMTIAGKNIDITGVALTGSASEESVVRVVATEGDVNFNDVHEVQSSYSYEHESSGLFTHRTEEIKEATAVSKTSSVDTGGKFIVDAAKDIVFTGGDYKASSGTISAKGDVTVKTSQDHAVKETKVTESSLEFGYSHDVPFVEASQTTFNTLDGVTVEDTEYQSGASENNMSSSNTKRPGAAATADTASFHAGLKTVETVTSESSIVNKNVSFDFSQGADFSAGKTLDIGGMDLAIGDDATANLTGKDIISTKYENVYKTSTETTETFIGIKGEGHSTVLDAANKLDNLRQKGTNEGMEVDAGLTAAEVGGDISNVVFNDLAGGSVSAGWSQTKDAASSETRSENINKLSGGTINFSSQKDTTLRGVEVEAKEVNIDAGGDLTLEAAKSTGKETSSSSQHNAALSWSGGAGATGAGVGASYDYTGSQSTRDKNTETYSNSQINAGSVNVNVKGDMTMEGASITAGSAQVAVGGDLAITSVQDTSVETASSQEWGGSLGVAVSTSGVLPTVAVNGGGGGEEHISKVTTAQSGINTTGEVTISTGGDLNLTGGHIISDSQTGSVQVGGVVNAVDLQDNIDSEGVYTGGGGGISYKGVPTANYYRDSLDSVHYKEDQHSTINVGVDAGEVKGNLNTDGDKISTVVQDDKKAGNNISYTISKLPSRKGNTKQKATTEEAAKPQTPSVSDSSSSATQKPGSSEVAKPQTPSVSDSSSSATQKPGSSEAAKPQTPSVSDSSSSTTQKPGSSEAAKPQTPSVSDSSSSATQNPGSSEAAKPASPTISDAGTDTVDSPVRPAKKWPTVTPADSYVGGTGSASRPSSGNYAGSVKPANNAPVRQNSIPETNGSPAAQRDSGAKKAAPAKKWPTVTPVRPLVGGTGSATRPGSVNYSGSALPAGNSPRGSEIYGTVTPPGAAKDELKTPTDGLKKRD